MLAKAENFESRENPGATRLPDHRTRVASAASWGAILAGAAAAASMSLILLILGTGLGLSAVSPWVNDGIGATAFTVSSIVWLGFTSLVASGVGGYLAGRLRTRWLAVDPDEVYFRDTAHGFLTWAVATLLTAVLLTSAIAGIVGTGVKAAAAVGGGAIAGGSAIVAGAANLPPDETGSRQYVLDALFRSNSTVAGNAAAQPPAEALAEAGRIVANALTLDAMPQDDLHHGALLISRHTGLSEQAAAARLSAADAKIRSALRSAETAAIEAADAARQASAKAALWLFVALLGGAFVASLSATFGGRQRDQY